jgi:hypothetical protein
MHFCTYLSRQEVGICVIKFRLGRFPLCVNKIHNKEGSPNYRGVQNIRYMSSRLTLNAYGELFRHM